MKNYKAIIIDDEALARDLIKNYLLAHKEIELIGECDNGFDGLKMINELKPDIVFLDIQMPKLNGFEVLELIEEKTHIIFTTAYDQYAVRAFEFSAIDYLLKPFSQDRFNQALDKIMDINNKQDNKLDNLIETVNNNKDFLNRIVVKRGDEIKILLPKDIFYIEANDDYVMLYTENQKYIKNGTMKYYENKLDTSKFFRIHRSYIVQIDKITKLSLMEKNSYKLTLTNGLSLSVSRTKFKELKSILEI